MLIDKLFLLIQMMVGVSLFVIQLSDYCSLFHIIISYSLSNPEIGNNRKKLHEKEQDIVGVLYIT